MSRAGHGIATRETTVPGTVVANGMVYSNSGYTHFGIVGSEMTGNVVLAFSLGP